MKILFLFDSKICSDPPMINDESKKRRKEKPFYQIKADALKLNNKKRNRTINSLNVKDEILRKHLFSKTNLVKKTEKSRLLKNLLIIHNQHGSLQKTIIFMFYFIVLGPLTHCI